VRYAARPSKPTLSIDSVLLLGALVVCIASALALAARVSWVAELFTHFRVQYVAAQVPILLALIVRRRMLAASLVVPFLALNLVAVGAYVPWSRSPAFEREGLTLMTANLGLSNADGARFVALVRDVGPDVIVLLEVTAGWSETLGALEREYPAQYFEPREDPFGIGIMSRLPLTAVETLDLRGAPAIDAQLTLHEGGGLRIVGAHLWPPVSRNLATERNAQLAELRRLIDAESEPAIVTGDFNITPYSPLLDAWLEDTGFDDPRRGHGFSMTWPTYFPVLGIPIDHCFVSKHVMASEPRRSAAFGSDHFAITTSLSLRDQ
jgi:endonuclease/exonuclease/phosphatase (EEP) superfamily protein YafD